MEALNASKKALSWLRVNLMWSPIFGRGKMVKLHKIGMSNIELEEEEEEEEGSLGWNGRNTNK